MSAFSDIVKEYKKLIVGVLAFITMGSLTIIFDGVDTLRDILEAPQEIIRLQSELDSLKKEVHHNIDVAEMDWELARLMTDNNDSTDFYYFADDLGAVYEVDIRETAPPEKFKLAFVAKMFIVYPIHFGPNGRMYVMLHDSQEQNTYLYKKAE